MTRERQCTSMIKQIKDKKCNECGKDFTPFRPLQKECDWACALKKVRRNNEQKAQKQYKEQTKRMKEAALTHKDWLNLAQIAFNTFVRIRDKNKPCITCGTVLTQKYDAGHFYSVGGNPSVRFHADNCHAQCVHCNQHKHGNLIEYAEKLPLRIGQANFEALRQLRNTALKLSIPEIKALIFDFKQATKKLIDAL